MGQVEVTGAGTVQVEAGDEVVIRLPENATTGYVWSVGAVADNLALTGDEPTPAGGGGVGVEGERVFRVRAVAPGSGDVVLRLGRVWEPAPIEERARRSAARRCGSR